MRPIPKNIYAVIGQGDGDDIAEIGGLPLVCLGEHTKDLMSECVKKTLPPGKRVWLIKFSAPTIIEDIERE